MTALAVKLRDRRLRNRACALRHYHRRADHFTRLGLTSRGLPRLRAANRTLAERRQFARARSLARWRARAAGFTASGLTTRGTTRVQHRLPPREQAWRELRATMRLPQPVLED